MGGKTNPKLMNFGKGVKGTLDREGNIVRVREKQERVGTENKHSTSHTCIKFSSTNSIK